MYLRLPSKLRWMCETKWQEHLQELSNSLEERRLPVMPKQLHILYAKAKLTESIFSKPLILVILKRLPQTYNGC